MVAAFCITGALIIGVVFALVFLKPKQSTDDIGDSYDQDIRVINESHPVKIILYGEPIYFRKEVKYYSVDHLSNDILSTSGSEYERVVLVVNDLNGTVTLSQEDLVIISGAVNDGSIDLYYLGKNNREKLINSGIRGGSAVIDGELSLVRAMSENRMINFIGFWTENEDIISRSNEELLGECIIDNIVNCIKSNN